MKKILFVFFSALLIFGCAGPPKRGTVFYPPLPQEPKLQFLHTISSEEDIGGKGSSGLEEFLLGKQTSKKIIVRPFDIGAVKGKIYVSDRTLKTVIVLDLKKKELSYIKGGREGALSEPAGIWVTEDDYKYVADFDRRQILVYNSNNRFVRAYGEKDQFDKPLGVAVYKNKIYVVDSEKNQVIVLDKESGKTIQEIGRIGQEEGEFYKPSYIRVDRAGNIYVNDAFNFRIQKFDSDGNFIKIFGYHGGSFGGFARPKGFDVDRDARLYVSDAAFENVQIFDDKLTDIVLFFGKFGHGPGDMYVPAAVYIDYDNVDYFNKYADRDFKIKYLVYVGNSLGRRKINVYGFGEWTGAELPEMKKKNIKK